MSPSFSWIVCKSLRFKTWKTNSVVVSSPFQLPVGTFCLLPDILEKFLSDQRPGRPVPLLPFSFRPDWRSIVLVFLPFPPWNTGPSLLWPRCRPRIETCLRLRDSLEGCWWRLGTGGVVDPGEDALWFIEASVGDVMRRKRLVVYAFNGGYKKWYRMRFDYVINWGPGRLHWG